MELVFDISQLENLRSLHEHEEKLRAESLKILESDTSSSEMLFLISNAMGILFGFSHDHEAKTDDELTLQYFGIRLFNTAAASIKLALAGYAQQALAQTRDILEVGFLLDYFRENPSEISVWKNSDKKARTTKYGPLQIRIALDKRDGNSEQKRQRAYALLSEYASHASYVGFTLTMKDGYGQIGPFVDEKKLKAWLQEISLRLLPTAEIFGRHFPNGETEPVALYKSYCAQILKWWKHHQTKSKATESGGLAPTGL